MITVLIVNGEQVEFLTKSADGTITYQSKNGVQCVPEEEAHWVSLNRNKEIALRAVLNTVGAQQAVKLLTEEFGNPLSATDAYAVVRGLNTPYKITRITDALLAEQDEQCGENLVNALIFVLTARYEMGIQQMITHIARLRLLKKLDWIAHPESILVTIYPQEGIGIGRYRGKEYTVDIKNVL